MCTALSIIRSTKCRIHLLMPIMIAANYYQRIINKPNYAT